MDSDHDDSSSSDEEYVPPTKLTKGGDISEGSSDSEEQTDVDDSLTDSDVEDSGGVGSRKLSKQVRSKNTEKPVTLKEETDCVDNKAKEDAIWNDFLATVEKPQETRVQSEATEVVRTYRFAGEEVQVTERVTSTNSDSSTPVNQNGSSMPTQLTKAKDVPQNSSPSKTILSNSSIPKTHLGAKSGLSSALQNLRSLASNKPPKLSTLEKSRLDWQNFVRKEDLEDDLRAHNKGKQGYLERQAFVDRATEREYAYQRSQLKRKL